MKTKFIEVVSYQEEWHDAFLMIKSELMHVLSDLDLVIEHVGSTSVVGLPSKPIIDIDVIIHRSDFSLVKERLESIAYHHEGDLGIPDREAFKYENKDHLLKHHLYVCPKDSQEYQRHLNFRDWLRHHEDDKEAYGKLKIDLAKKYPTDIESYLLGKSTFIENIYQKIKKNGS